MVAKLSRPLPIVLCKTCAARWASHGIVVERAR
jgi:hypothetical protein